MSPLGVLLANVSARSRGFVGAAAALGLAARLTVFATAVAIAHDDARLATLLGLSGGVLFFVHRAASSSARVEVEHDLYAATARSLVESDVLDVPADDVQRVTWEGNHHGRMMVASALPSVVADVAAAIAITPVLARVLPSRILFAAGAGALVVIATLFMLRGVSARLQARLLEASQRMNDELLVAVEGRLELVARGAEDAYARSFAATLAEYRVRARHAALGAALLGRAPLAAGIAVVGLIAVADAAARDAMAVVVLGQAIVLAAAAAPVLGIVMNANDLARLSTLTRAFVGLLGRPARAERSGDKRDDIPELPATVTVEELSFSYGDGRATVFDGLSFTWRPGRPLVLYGPNGSGKSTLLRLLLGLRAPTSGTITVDARLLASLDLVALRGRTAYLPQRPYLGEPYATVRSAMRLVRADADDAVMRRALDDVGLGVGLDTRIGELSAGQRQRVALARTAMQDARIVLLDEPDANLDRAGIARVGALVSDMVAAGKMVAVAAHTDELAPADALEITLGVR